ncbi:MAG: hypothetical protein LQ351_004302 [Letrouitia transgressa]|nr:MAG: hypothetical protein LQ351_004302 [Letrouitia transgressa]
MSVEEEMTLAEKLARSLPKDVCLDVHHLSAPPTSCPAIYSAPPGQKPEKTFCESHFLSVAISHNSSFLQVFAIEVLIYTTEALTTVFVSKADSTGYISLLQLPKETPSPLKTISSVFLEHLVTGRRRKDRQLVVSLFARAQDQYLFPGSIENSGKHVLDDRGLVKWWCRVLDPLLEQESLVSNKAQGLHSFLKGVRPFTSRAYLRVPGCDLYETEGFFPEHVRKNPSKRDKWKVSDPLRDLGRSPTLPERCLIPRFPDDPKSRFVNELDDELTEPPPQSQKQESPSKGRCPGRWRSVQSLEQFWELMAFRQECSSGRLVGFLWGVFTPEGTHTNGDSPELLPNPPSTPSKHKTKKKSSPSPRSQAEACDSSPSPKWRPVSDLQNSSFPHLHAPRPLIQDSKSLDLPASQPSNNLQPPATNAHPTSQTSPSIRPEKTKHYLWPPSSRGEIVLSEKHYHRVHNLLLHLDYANEEIAAESSKRWLDDVAMCAGVKTWGQRVVGRKEMPAAGQQQSLLNPDKGGVNMLGSGLVRKKRPNGESGGEVDGSAAAAAASATAASSADRGVNVLSTGLVRKKPKVK